MMVFLRLAVAARPAGSVWREHPTSTVIFAFAECYANGHSHRPTCAGSRIPMDLITYGQAVSIVHAPQDAAMIGVSSIARHCVTLGTGDQRQRFGGRG